MPKSVERDILKAETATSKYNHAAKDNSSLHCNCGILKDQGVSVPIGLKDAEADTEKESQRPKHLEYYSKKRTSICYAPKSSEPQASLRTQVPSLSSSTTSMLSSASSCNACSISDSAANSIKRSFDILLKMDLSCNGISVPPESVLSEASEMHFKEWSQAEKDEIVDFAKKYIINQEAISRQYGDCTKKKRRAL